MKFLHLNFVPRSSDLALLILRLWFGGLMIGLHGWGKLVNFPARAEKFADPFGLGGPATLVLVVFAEVVCAALLVVGAYTRAAAFVLTLNMVVAFVVAHGARLTGERNGELAFVFLAAYLALFLAGAGRISVDARIGAKAG